MPWRRHGTNETVDASRRWRGTDVAGRSLGNSPQELPTADAAAGPAGGGRGAGRSCCRTCHRTCRRLKRRWGRPVAALSRHQRRNRHRSCRRLARRRGPAGGGHRRRNELPRNSPQELPAADAAAGASLYGWSGGIVSVFILCACG